ncbi:MAG: VWA domain-containing protein [Maricaulaceae bacterium]
MFAPFFYALREARVPVSLREYLTLLEALQADVIDREVGSFYALARAALVKDERWIDAFDQVFGQVFKGVERVGELVGEADIAAIPEDWLRKLTERYLSDEEKAEIEALGGWDQLMETLKKRLEEQKGRHQGGSKWIGTGGTSPFGAYGYNPEGVRIGQHESRHRRAVKVWDKREFKNLADDVELGARNMKIALRKLRKFAREGAADELDLNHTIDATARQGWLEVKTRPERRNAVKVLLLLDVGGSMDPHVTLCERLFSAARSEFKNLEAYYFHNCPYEGLWRDNRRRRTEQTPTWDILHTFNADWRVVVVGDASMSPYEIMIPGGSVEHWNEEPGAVWLKRLAEAFPRLAWINPIPERYWEHTHSIGLVQDIIGKSRMAPLTLAGLDRAMGVLN